MKTPEEWLEIWKKDGDGDHTSSKQCEYELRFIREIQSDAVRGTVDYIKTKLDTIENKHS